MSFRFTPGLLLLAGLLSSGGAAAAPFDPTMGRISLRNETLAWDFDGLSSIPAGFQVQAIDVNNKPIANFPTGNFKSPSDAPAIEGHRALMLDATLYGVLVQFTQAPPFAGRRVEITFWARAAGVAPTALLSWEDTTTQRAVSRFAPSGRATSDGWVEYTSGPIDFQLAGSLNPLIRIIERRPENYPSLIYSQPNTTSSATPQVYIDALAVADLGPALNSGATCALTTESATCGDTGVCYFGRCVDAAQVLGQLPPDAIRSDYVDRRLYEIAHLGGNRVHDRTLPAVETALGQAKSATTAKAFWLAMIAAYDALGDGHGTPPNGGRSTPVGIGLCLHQGAADRLPLGTDGQPVQAPLVFSVDPTSPAQVRVGDALTAIDGLPVATWASRITWQRRKAHVDPAASDFVDAPNLTLAATTAGSLLTFTHPDGTTVNVDTKRLVGDAFYQSLPGLFSVFEYGCDYRFVRPGGGDAAGYDDTYVGLSNDSDGLRSVAFNGLPDPSTGTPSWGSQISSAIPARGTGPSLYLLDTRTGHGGYLQAVDMIIAPFFGASEVVHSESVPQLEEAYDDTLRNNFVRCATDRTAQSGCGSFEYDQVGDSTARGARSNARVALLTTFDISSNDYLTAYLHQRAEATRIFGPCPTAGAFGSIMGMALSSFEFSGGSLQFQDSLVYRNDSPLSYTFLSGAGVPPDVTVLQKQSDLLTGTDTIVEAAKAWLRGGGN